MRALAFVLAAAAAGVAGSTAEAAGGDVKRGAELYRACVACHALEPGLHLTGPSLGDVIGRKAGAAEGFVRYSRGLKEAEFTWNAAALDGWLANPAEMIPGTYMVFRGIDDAGARADLVAFLGLAGVPGGAERAVNRKLIPGDYIRAIAPDPVGQLPPNARVASIRHCGDSYFVKTQDGVETPYWEMNVRLKVDSRDTGPSPGEAVIFGAGMQGDRVSAIFASLADLKALVVEKC